MSFIDCIPTKKSDWQQARSLLPITNNGFSKIYVEFIFLNSRYVTIFFLTMFCLIFI